MHQPTQTVLPSPASGNCYLEEHAQLLCSSFTRWTGRHLLSASFTNSSCGAALFHADIAVVSHDTTADPCFNYANLLALKVFEMEWLELVGLPSRKSAEPINQAERSALLERVSRDGFIDDYQGVRISKSGRRFQIEEATVWNLLDSEHRYRGQAAVFASWHYL